MRRHHRAGGVVAGARQQDAFTPAKAFDPSRPARPSPLAASTIRGIPLDLVDRIRSFSFFANAPEEFLVAVGSCLRLQVYSAQESILNEGDEAKAMYWLIRGAVMVTSRDRESVYVELPPGSFFGEIGIMMNVPRTASIVAKYKSLVARLNKEDLQKELPKYPAVERALREEAAERLAILERKKNKVPLAPPSKPETRDRKGSKRTHDLLDDDVEMTDDGAGDEHPRGRNKKLKSPSPRPSIVETTASSALGFGTIHIRSLLKELPLFSKLPDEFLHFLGLNAESRSYPPFTTILKQRSFGRDVFFVTDGMVEVITDGGVGGEEPATPKYIVRARLQSGHYFGEVTSLSLAPQRTATVRTITSVECLVISGDVIDELWRQCPPELRSSVETTARRRLKANADFGNVPMRDEEGVNHQARERDGADVAMADASEAVQPSKPADGSAPPPSSVAFKDVAYQGPTKYSTMSPEPYDPDPFFNTERPPRRPGMSRRGSLANVPAEASPLAKDGSEESGGPEPDAAGDIQQETAPPSRPRLASSQANPSGKGILPDNVLTRIFQHLDVYQLMRCRRISGHWSRLVTKSPDILEVLDLSIYNRRVTDSILSNVIAPFVGNRPRSIDISNCFHLTDEGFSTLFSKCGENVTHLRMKSVWDITPHAIVQMVNKSNNLRSVDFSNCRKVSDNLLNRVVGWVVRRRPSNPNPPHPSHPPEGTIIGCPKLSRLTLSYCKHVSDRFMLHLAHHAADRLEQMDLTRCTTISDVGFRHWGDRTFPKLAKLVLADCTYLSDNAIVCLTQAARNLRELDLSFCCALSDASVDRLSAALPRLHTLNLAFCGSAVSDASMANIGQGLKELRDLSVRGCVRVTRTGVEAVLDGCDKLEVFDVSQCRNLVMEREWESGKVKFLVVADGTWRVNN